MRSGNAIHIEIIGKPPGIKENVPQKAGRLNIITAKNYANALTLLVNLLFKLLALFL